MSQLMMTLFPERFVPPEGKVRKHFVIAEPKKKKKKVWHRKGTAETKAAYLEVIYNCVVEGHAHNSDIITRTGLSKGMVSIYVQLLIKEGRLKRLTRCGPLFV